jgi:predicted GIY-YIG superfamily endonuclease
MNDSFLHRATGLEATKNEPPCMGLRYKFTGIYAIKHIATGRYYVGHSRDLYSRTKQHRSELHLGRHPNPNLQHAYLQDARIEFEYVLTNLDEELALSLEQQILDRYYDTGLLFNRARSAMAMNKDMPVTDEIRERNRLNRLGKPHHPHTRSVLAAILQKASNAQSIPVTIHGETYRSRGEASRVTGIPSTTLKRWIREGKV